MRRGTPRHVFFAYQRTKPVVLPDIMVAAKPLACGLPLGVIVANEKAAASDRARACTARLSAAARWLAAWRSSSSTFWKACSSPNAHETPWPKPPRPSACSLRCGPGRREVRHGDEGGAFTVSTPSPDGPFVASDVAARNLRGAHELACELYRDLDRSDRAGDTLDRVAINLAGTFDMAGGHAKGLYGALGFDRYLGFIFGLDLKLELDLVRHLYLDLNSARDQALNLADSRSNEAAGEIRSLLVEHARLRARVADIVGNLGQALTEGAAATPRPLRRTL